MSVRQPLLWASAHDLLPDVLRPTLLRRLGIRIPNSALIRSGLRIIGDGTATIGSGAFLNHDCLLETADEITIGERVSFGYGVMIMTSAHDIEDPSHRAGPWRVAPVKIGAGAWLGAGVTVMSGVTIGPGAVIGAGSIVTHDCAANGLYLGAPARWVKDLPTTGK